MIFASDNWAGAHPAIAAALAERGVYLLPGSVFGRPGHFRISLTATMAMLEKALPALREIGAQLAMSANTGRNSTR